MQKCESANFFLTHESFRIYSRDIYNYSFYTFILVAVIHFTVFQVTSTDKTARSPESSLVREWGKTNQFTLLMDFV